MSVMLFFCCFVFFFFFFIYYFFLNCCFCFFSFFIIYFLRFLSFFLTEGERVEPVDFCLGRKSCSRLSSVDSKGPCPLDPSRPLFRGEAGRLSSPEEPLLPT